MSLLDDIYTASVVDRWSRVQSPSSSLEFRYLMLASAPKPPEGWTADDLEPLRANYRTQMEAFLAAADDYGILRGPGSKDLIARLRSANDSNFRSARSECLAAWYLGVRLGLRLEPRPPGRGGPLELVIQDRRGRIPVEVKAPCRKPIVHTPEQVMSGRVFASKVDDTDIIAECVRKARKQFTADTANLVFLASELTLPYHDHRRFLTGALYGQEKMLFRRNPQTFEVSTWESVIEPNGLFLAHLEKNTRPEYTRVSAVLYLEESHEIGAGPFDVNVLLVHNPFAARPIPDDLWADTAQLTLVDNALVWSDGFRRGAGPS